MAADDPAGRGRVGSASVRIVLVAGEASGDNLGAGLIAALNARRPGLTFEGIAGPRMVAAGCLAWASAERLSIMGLFEVLKHLPDLLKLFREIEERTVALQPAVFVGIDAPDTNLRLAKRLKRHRLTTVQYVSPQVWAWRRGRVRQMSRTLDLVLCLLPFEKKFYDGQGLSAEFVGHPLADRLPLVPDRAAARARLGIPGDTSLVALLPGSRRGEVERLAADFIGAARWLAVARPGVRFVAPMANPAARAIFEAALATHGDGLSVQLTDGEADTALTACNCALIASGTATLEAMLCKRPMVVAYKVAPATARLIRLLGLIKSPFIAQPNLLAGREVVPELVQREVEPERLGIELRNWLDAHARVQALEAEFTRIHVTLRRGASDRAAEAILKLIDRAGPGSS